MSGITSATASITPPTPLHLLRSHTSPVSAIAWSDDNERIYSADASGKVIVTSTRSLRAIASWMAHTDSILGVEEWGESIVTHGRDNKLHVWQRIEELPASARIGGSAGLPDLPTPTHRYSMDVNALNFCRFSLLRLPDVAEENSKQKALIALPNLIDSTTADVWSLPTIDRLHAAIGQETKIFPSSNATGRNNSGIIMSMHLYQQNYTDAQSPASDHKCLRLLMAYENGSVVLREYTRTSKEVSIEGEGWDILWKSKLHVESVMAMRVSRANDFALTVSADHIIGRYDLRDQHPPSEEHATAFRSKHAGNGSIAIRDDGRVCAAGGWDGKIRLYSTKSFKSLGTLKYHKSACQCIEFARAFTAPSLNKLTQNEEDDEYEDFSVEEMSERSRWLVAGAKDNRISIWSLMSFEK
ncbi:ASTRA-associated protein 1 [Psilocybe cubensis]|uniref:ASTRA-associated protein 1 n=2 Tax=Psilocybe cubensis TaxID=181762 RepID=A0A8H7Y315_PSICU|nr:ASTRA-associated protein 1 [Psilocybe cubensis]KAH9481428.1 ASTRA-associated protein 1 [Psilocybe cubensis]